MLVCHNEDLVGKLVRTTDEYYERNRRRVRGVVVEPKIDIGTDMVIVKWVEQTGDVNRSLNNQMVLMYRDCIEIDT